MKKIVSIMITLLLCINLTACGSDQTTNQENNDQTNITDTTDDTQTDLNQTESLPMNIQEGYTCTVNGYEGYVVVSNYEVYPDDMNPGSQIRTATMHTVFENVPEDFSVGTTVFPVSGAPEYMDDYVYLIETEDGEDLIFKYDNMVMYSTYENGTYTNEMLVSYVVPEYYDEVAFALTYGEPIDHLSTASKEEIVSSDTLWFTMGSLHNGILSYQGRPLATAVGTVNVEEVFGNITGNGQYEDDLVNVPDEPSNNLSFQIIETNAIMSASNGVSSISFGPLTLLDYYDGIYNMSVEINYTGIPSNSMIECFLFDALTEVHIDRLERSVEGNGTIEFFFESSNITPPFTFSAGIITNGEYSNNIHVDVEVQ
ncbi:MAG: hypothetical protein E7191_00490 [Erysipelotrichaceae bacterium]|nr:hypothetical protein [Erysipelotrichaceae bacterium]